jgi:ABC-2 type transport system permease protein
MTGTVFDIGYQRYTGDREGVRRGRVAVFKDGVRTALGFGRGGRAKILPWFFVALLTGIAFVMVLVAGAADRIAGPEAAAQMNLPTHGDYYGVVSTLLFVFAALVAPELICPDRREGTINLYLTRPLTGTDYIFGRWAAFLVVILFAAWLPQIVLFMGYILDAAKPLEYLKEHWQDIPQFLLSGLAISAYATTLAMLVASFTTRRAYASVFLVGLFIISTPFTIGLASEIDGPVGQWISMFNLANIPVHVNDVIFGINNEITEDAPAKALGNAMLVWWYFAWIVVPGTLLWSRYRRLTP